MAMTDNLTAAVDEVKAYNEKLERVRSTYNALSPEKKQKYAHEMQARLAQEAGSYINSYNYLENSFRDQYGKQGYKTADEADKYAARLRQMSSRVSQRARRYADIMDIYGADMDEDFRTQFNEILDGTRTGMYQLNNAALQNKKYYGQFADEDEYNIYLDYQAHPEKYTAEPQPVYTNFRGEEVDIEQEPQWKIKDDYEQAEAEVERLKQEKKEYGLDYQEWRRSFTAESRKYGADPETRASNPEYQQFVTEWDAEDARRQAEYDDYDARIAEAEARAKELDKEYTETFKDFNRINSLNTWAHFLEPPSPRYEATIPGYGAAAALTGALVYAEGGDPNSSPLVAGGLDIVAPVTDAVGYVGEVAGINGAEKWRDQAAEWADTAARMNTQQKAGKGKLGQAGVDLVQQGVPVLADAALNYATGGAAGLVSLGVRSFGGGTMEARQGGGNLLQQGLYGAGSAAVEIITEKMFDAYGGKVYGASSMDDVINHWAGASFKSPAGRAVAKYVVDAAGEGIEEVMSDVINPVLKSIYNNRSVLENLSDLKFDEIAYDFAMGAALGALGGSVNVVAESAGNISERDAFFMEAGAKGVDFADAAREWKRIQLSNAKATGSGEIYDTALEYERALNNGERVSEKKIDKLNARAVKELSNADIANTMDAVQGRLNELGVNDPALAQAIAAVALAEEAEKAGAKEILPTAEQRKMVANSKIAQRVLSEMDVENMRREAEAEYALTRANSEGKATKADYDRVMPQFFRTNEWVKNMEPNKLLAADVYGEKSGAITVSSEEKLDKIKVGDKELYVVGVEDGKIKLKQGAKGKAYKTIAVDDIEGISDSYRMLLTAAAARKSGSAMLKAYRPGQDLVSFVRAWDLAEQVYGKLTNITFAQARKAFNLRALSDVQLQAALDVGRAAAPKTSNKVTKKEVSGELTFWKGGEIEGTDYDATNEAEARKLLGDDEVDFVKNTLSKVADVTLVKSKADENGNFTGAQGIFYENGHIYIDVNAGLDSADIGQRTIILTAAHEMTHYIRSYNEAAYEALRDFIVAELTAKGQNIEDLMLEKQARSSEDLSDDAALEEVIADSCEMMFTDVSKVKAFASAHEAEARTIWKWLDKFLSNMKERFSGLKAAHREAAAMMDKIDEMRKIWFKALGEIQTGESNATIETATEPADLVHSDTNSLGFTTAVTDETGHATFSLRTYEQSGRKNLDAFLAKQVEKKALKPKEADQMRAQLDELYKVCKTYDNGKYAPFSAWSNAEVVTVNGRPVFSVVKKNGEYKLNLDFSLVCKKRRTLDAVFNEMIRRGIMNRAFGEQGYLEMRPETIAEINNIIRAHGFETACALCFVDSKRYRQAMIADAFADMYNEQVRSLVEGTDMQPTYFNYGGDRGLFNEVKTRTDLSTVRDSDLNWSKVNEILADKSLKGKVVYKIAESLKKNPKNRKLASRGDFMSTAGFDALNAENPELLSLYNSKKGAGGPKAAQSDVQYLNEVIQQGKFSVKAAYAVGGVRIQSFSDYVGRLVFDYVQMVADLAAKQLPAHAYTKEFMFAQQFGLTGIKINMSLVPAVVDGGVAPGLDENGNYAWKDGQSFGSTVYDNKGKRMTAQEGFELAIKIQNAEGYSRNCGTIAVGVSDEHILKMLSDPNIRMIIPYHKSGLNHLVAAMNQIDKYTDYTNYQNTMMQNERGEWVKIPAKQEFNWNETLQKMEKQGKGAKEAAQAYIAWCEKNNYRPKFDRDGMEFSKHENYYKLLEDFSAYDSDGKPAPLGAVQMNFPTEASEFGSMQDLIEAGLEEDAMLQAKQEGGVDDIVNEIETTLPGWEAEHPEGKAKKSDRDLPFQKNASDAERYRYLRGARIAPAVYTQGSLDIEVDDLPGKTLDEKFKKLKSGKMPIIKKAMKTLADKLGIPDREFSSSAIDIEFGYSKGAVDESVQYLNKDRLLSFAKALTVFDQIAQNAIPINIRDDIYSGLLYDKETTPTQAWYSCISAYYDEGKIIPVKISIDERRNEKNRAHLVVTLSEMQAVEKNKGPGIDNTQALNADRKNASRNDAPPRFDISVAEILQNVKSDEYELLRDTPDGFLNDEQIQGKAIAQEMFERHLIDKIESRAKVGKIDAKFIEKAYEEAKATGDRDTASRLRKYHSDRDNLGYHAGDLGKAEHLNIQGRSRGTGHFGTGTYFVGVEEKVTKDSHYGKRPQHAVDFSDYNLFKVRNDRDGYRLHDALKIIDGGINKEWISPAIQNQFNIVNPTGYYDLARSKYGEDWASGDNLLNSILEYAKENGIDVKSLEEYKAEEGKGIDDEDLKYYYEDYAKDTVKEKISDINAEYRELMDAVFDLRLLPGFTNAKIFSALQAVAEYQDATPRNARADSYATVFMKAMGYEGIDVRDTGLDNTAYGSVIYDVKPETVRYSERDNAAAQKTKEHYQDRLDKLRAEKNAKIKDIRKEETARRQEAVKKEKAAKWEKVEETKEYYRDMMGRDRARRSDTKTRGKIKDLHKELTNMLLKPGENRYVPKSLVKATAEILDAVDITTGKPTKASEAFAALRSKYDALKTDEHYSAAYDETVSGMLQKLAETVGDGNIYDLTGNDLEAVYTTLKAMKHIIQTANKLVGAEIEKAASEVALQMINETRSAKEMKLWPQRFFSLSVTNPRVMFNVLGNYRKNSAWSQMYDMLNKGQLTQTQTLMEGGQIFRSLIDDKRVESLHRHGQKDLLDIGLTDSSGNSVKVTRGMMLSIYMHLLNEQNAKHIMYGGLTVPRFNEYYGNLFKAANMKEAYKGVTIRAGSFSEEMVEINRQLREAETQEEIDALNERLDELQADAQAYLDNIRTRIENELNDYDRAWIQAAQTFFDDYSKRKLNEVTEMVYGFQKAQVDNYFPIHTDPDYRTANFESIARDMSLENAGFMKERINGSNPILLEDITDVLNNQLRRTAQYVGLMPAIRNFNKVYGKSTAGYGDSVQKAVGAKFHSTGTKAIENLMADLNGARYKDPTVFDSIRGNVAASNLTINPRVTLAQVASYPTAAAEIGYAPLIKAIKDVARNPIFNAQAAEEVAKWTPLWWYRMQGYSNAELGDIKSNGQFMKKVMDKTKWLTGWIQFADGLTTGALWQASKYYVDENFSSLEKGSDEYMMKVAEVYNKVIERTQPDYTTMQRPDLLRSPNSTVKMLTMFMTQRLQNYSLLYDSAAQYASYKQDYKKGINGVTAADVKSAGTKLAWTVSSQLIAAATIVTFKLLADALLHNMNAYRDDDEELTGESVSKQLLLNWLESLASNVVAGSEIFSLLSTAFTHERYYGVSLNGVSAITDTASDVQKLLDKTLSGNGEASRKAALSLAQDLSQILGIPTRNAIKIVDAVKYHYEDAKNGQLGSFEAGVERSKSTNAKLLYRALETGDAQRATYLKGQYANEKEYRSAVKGYVKTLFVDEHGITRQKAKDALVKYVGMTPKEAEKTSLEWQMEADTGIAYGNLRDEYVSGRVSAANAAKYIVKYGGQNEAEAEAKVSEWQCEKDTGIAYSDIDTEVKTGRLEPEKAIAMLEKYGGKDEDKATKTVEGWRIEHEYGISPDDLEEEYLAGNVSEDEALDILQRYKFYGKEDAAERAAEEIEKYDFIAGNPGVEDITVTQVRQYKASGLENFVSPVDYFEALKVTNTFKGLDEDNDGRTDSYSVAMQKMRYIDEMDLTPEQKTALARALGISEKTIKRRAPWR